MVLFTHLPHEKKLTKTIRHPDRGKRNRFQNGNFLTSFIEIGAFCMAVLLCKTLYTIFFTNIVEYV